MKRGKARDTHMHSVRRGKRSRARLALIVSSGILAVAGCSSTSDPGPGPGPGNNPTHPAGTAVTSTAVGSRPYGIAVSKDGVVFVTQLDTGTVTRLSLATGAIAGTVTVGNVPTDVAFNASGTTAYVTNQFSSNLGVVNVAAGTQGLTTAVGGTPFRVALQPVNGHIYVSSNSDSIYVVDAGTNAVTARIEVGLDPNGFAFNAAGTRLWISNQSDGTVTELNTATNAVIRTITVNGTPQDLVVSPDGTELYIANLATGVEVWNLASASLTLTLPFQGGGFGLALTPDGTQLYAAATVTGKVYIIDRVTRTFVQTLNLGGLPRRIAFSATGDVAVISNEAGSVTFVR